MSSHLTVTIRRKIPMLTPDDTPTQPLPRITDTTPLRALQTGTVELPASLSPRGLPVDPPEPPFQGTPPPLFGSFARLLLVAVFGLLSISGVLIAFQAGQLSVPTAPFAGDQSQATASASPKPKGSTKASPTPTKTTPHRVPTQDPAPTQDDAGVVPVVDTPATPPATTPEATPSAPSTPPTTPTSEPSTPATTAPATTQPPTSTPPVPTDQPTATAPPSEDLETTPPTE